MFAILSFLFYLFVIVLLLCAIPLLVLFAVYWALDLWDGIKGWVK